MEVKSNVLFNKVYKSCRCTCTTNSELTEQWLMINNLCSIPTLINRKPCTTELAHLQRREKLVI